MTGWEPYRVITDYEALQDGFLDRIDDLDTTMSAIPGFADYAGGWFKHLKPIGTATPTRAL